MAMQTMVDVQLAPEETLADIKPRERHLWPAGSKVGDPCYCGAERWTGDGGVAKDWRTGDYCPSCLGVAHVMYRRWEEVRDTLRALGLTT